MFRKQSQGQGRSTSTSMDGDKERGPIQEATLRQTSFRVVFLILHGMIKMLSVYFEIHLHLV